MAELTHLLRSKAVLMPGVSVTLVNEKTKESQNWLYKGGLRDYLTQTLNGDPVIPLFDGEGFADSQNDSFAEGEGASLVRGLHRRRPAGARELRQPDSHQRRRHARKRPARWPVPRPSRASSNCTALLPKGVKLHARRRVCPRQLCAVGQGAGPAVPGPDQGAAELARRGAPGVELCASGAGAVAEPACGLRQKAGRAGHQSRRRPARSAGQKVEKRKSSRRGACCPAS